MQDPWEGVVVTSRANPHAKQLSDLLRHKKAREETGLFALEGRRLCLDAYRANLVLHRLFLTPPVWESAAGELAQMAQSWGPVTVIGEELALRVGDTQTPQGVFAVCKAPSFSPEAIPLEDARLLLLHRVRDPGNLGSILRTAAALGASGALLCDCAELLAPKVLRAAMGGVWRLPIGLCGDMSQTISHLRHRGVACWAAALQPGASHTQVLTRPGAKAVLIGNEGEGLPPGLIDACDGAVMLPMKGGSDSLGAAMAAGILLWELLR